METTAILMNSNRQAPAQSARGLRTCYSMLRRAYAAACAALCASALAATLVGAEPVLGQWILGAGQGDSVPDTSGAGPDARLSEGVRWTQVGDRSALEFDGQSGAVDCGEDARLNPAAAITVEAWVLPRSFGQGNYGRIVDRGVYSLMMHAVHGWGFAFTLQDEQGETHSSALGEPIPLRRYWYHVVGTFDGHVQKLFVNGIEGSVKAEWSGKIRASPARLLIGNIGTASASAAPGTRAFDGFIDEAAVFGRALTPAEIGARYAEGKPRRGHPADAAETAAAHTLFRETFADGKASLARWAFERKSGACAVSLTHASRLLDAYAAYVDFRQTGAWTFLAQDTVALAVGAQYTLSARVRRNLGYGAIRLVAMSTGAAPSAVVAEAEVLNRNNVSHEVSVVFQAAADTQVRVGVDARGYSELWIESVRLQQNIPPLSPYTTGLLLPARSPTTQARYRTGVFIEAEDILATPDTVTSDDADGDARWAVCRLDPKNNPWLFSDDTVIKSDTLADDDGGSLPPLQLAATGLLPGPYEVILSDPQRDAAVSMDGQTWRRVTGGAGEIKLGLLDVPEHLSVWVGHRFRSAANPGPIYVDYLRLMPVYDAARGMERPVALPPPPVAAPIQRTTLRLFQTRTVVRRQEWVTAGVPFARGAFRPEHGLRVASVARLTTQPLVLWPDGSVKWLRLQFQADCDAGGAELPVEFGRDVPGAGTPAQATPPVAAQTFRCGQIEISCRDGVWDQLSIYGRPLLSQPLAVRLRTATGLHCDRLRIESAAPVSQGTRPGVSVKGHLLAADGKPAPLAFQAVLTETAPQTLLLRFSVLNESDERYAPEKGCSPALPLTEFALIVDGIQISPSAVQWPTTAVPFDGAAQTLLQTGTGACVAEFKGAWDLRAGDTVAATGERTDGWLDLRGAGTGLAVGVHEFVERCPQRITVRKSGSGLAIEIGVWPAAGERVFRFAQGTRLTTEVALVPHDGALASPDRDACLASVLDPLCAALPPAYYCQTGVFGPVTEKRDSRFEAYYASAAHTFNTLRAKQMKYGIEDWGDYFAPCGYVQTDTKLWTNMEWNYPAVLLIEFVRTGDPEFWRAAQQAARHFVDADIIHCSSTPAWVGGSYVHTGDTREGHQVDPPNFAHAGWPEGVLWVYYMAGDERLREASVGLADYVVRNMPPDGPYQAQPPFSMWNLTRQTGNPLLTLITVHELTRDPVHLRTLNRQVDYAVRVQDPKLGCWSVPCYEDPAYHHPSQNWGAMLLRGLHLYWQMTGDQRVAQSFRRLGDFYIERHAPETRRHLKPGSYYRTDFTFVAEACAFASLFAADPKPILDKGMAAYRVKFPVTPPQAFGARGAPGALIGACRLAGAVAAADAAAHQAATPGSTTP